MADLTLAVLAVLRRHDCPLLFAVNRSTENRIAAIKKFLRLPAAIEAIDWSHATIWRKVEVGVLSAPIPRAQVDRLGRGRNRRIRVAVSKCQPYQRRIERVSNESLVSYSYQKSEPVRCFWRMQ